MLGEIASLSGSFVALLIVMFVLTVYLTKRYVRWASGRGITGVDHHKSEKPEVAEWGGVVVFACFVFFSLVLYYFFGVHEVGFILMITSLFGVYGLVDDISEMHHHHKLLVSVLFGLIAALTIGSGPLEVVWIVFFTLAAGNIVNIFAGLNGLEMGVSTIAVFFLALYSLVFLGAVAPLYISMGFFVILFAFLIFNSYPADVFPGDVGTLVVGGFIASFAVRFDLYLQATVLLLPHILDCILKGSSKGYFSPEVKKSGDLNGDELKPRKDFRHLIGEVLKRIPDEKKAVHFFWAVEIVLGIVLVVVSL